MIAVDDELLAGLDRRRAQLRARWSVARLVDARGRGPGVGVRRARRRARAAARGRARTGSPSVSRAYLEQGAGRLRRRSGRTMLRDFDRTTAPPGAAAGRAGARRRDAAAAASRGPPSRASSSLARMEIDLSGRTAFVSGSTQGIGRAIAARLARSGAAAVVNGRDEAARGRGGRGAARRAAGRERRAASPPTSRPPRAPRRCSRGCPTSTSSSTTSASSGPTPLLEVDDATWQRYWDVNVMSGDPAHAPLRCRDARPRLGARAVHGERLGGRDPDRDGPLRRDQDRAARGLARVREGAGRHRRDRQRGDRRADAHRGRRGLRARAGRRRAAVGRGAGGVRARAPPARRCSSA